MSNIEIDIQGYLKKKNYTAFYTEYLSSPWHKITTNSNVSLISEPTLDLSINDKRYFLADGGGIIHTDELTKEEFEEKLPHYLTKRVESHIEIRTVFDVILNLIAQLDNRFTVYGYTQETIETFRVIEPQILFEKILKYPGKLPKELFDREIYECESYLLDDDGEPVMVEAEFAYYKGWNGEDTKTYFKIFDQDNQLVLNKIELLNLPIILYSLKEGFSPAFIKKQFLQYRDSHEQPLIFSGLAYAEIRESDLQKITTQSDFSRVNRLISSTFKTEVEYFLYVEGNREFVAPNAIMHEDLLQTIAERKDDLDPQEGQLLSNKLIDLAKSYDLEIYRRDSHNISILFVEDIKYQNGKIIDFKLYERFNDSRYGQAEGERIKEQYNIVVKSTQEKILKEGEFQDMIVALLKYTTKKSTTTNE